MSAYIDETGHSGRNIFDNNEFFRLGTLLTVSDISEAVDPVTREFIDIKNVDRLHENEWPEHDLVGLAHQIIDTLTASSSWTFNLFSVHKPYIAPTKFVDMIFDAGENRAVPGYWYWDEMHRHVLCLVTDAAMSRDLERTPSRQSQAVRSRLLFCRDISAARRSRLVGYRSSGGLLASVPKG